MKTISSLVFLLCLAVNVRAQTESIIIEQRADTVIITNMAAWENCAAGFSIDITVQGSSVVMTETDTIKQKARCMCHFDLSAALSGLSAGTYTVEIYRQYWKKFDYPEDKKALIGTATFEVIQPNPSPQYVRCSQSECYQISATEALLPTPDDITLHVYPNPAREEVTIQITCVQTERVRILLFDALGNEVDVPVEKNCPAGASAYVFPAERFTRSGSYYCVVSTSNGIKIETFTVIR